MYPSNTPDKWVGQIYNAEDGNTYRSSFTMNGANAVQIKACVIGGLVCKGQMWTRTAAARYENPSASAGVPLKAGIPLKKSRWHIRRTSSDKRRDYARFYDRQWRY
jgi:hypothetical protein